jgi:hypothetical protein
METLLKKKQGQENAERKAGNSKPAFCITH